MKKLLTFLLIATTFAACDCKHGYGPNNCKDTWASNYTGTWSAEVECSGSLGVGFSGNSTITEETATSIRIDGDIFATLYAWDKFNIPTQQVNGATITGTGGITENTTTNNNGSLINIGRTVWYNITIEQNGQSANCSGLLQ